MKGGIDNPDEDSVIKEDDGKTYFYQKFYEPTFGRFEDPPKLENFVENQKCNWCVSCRRLEKKRNEEETSLGELTEVGAGKMSDILVVFILFAA